MAMRMTTAPGMKKRMGTGIEIRLGSIMRTEVGNKWENNVDMEMDLKMKLIMNMRMDMAIAMGMELGTGS